MITLNTSYDEFVGNILRCGFVVRLLPANQISKYLNSGSNYTTEINLLRLCTFVTVV